VGGGAKELWFQGAKDLVEEGFAGGEELMVDYPLWKKAVVIKGQTCG
jgi:hypothetical protein